MSGDVQFVMPHAKFVRLGEFLSFQLYAGHLCWPPGALDMPSTATDEADRMKYSWQALAVPRLVMDSVYLV